MYPGGKAGSGVYQTIINQIPPHDVYIEAFAGGAAVLRNKRPASCSIAIDADKRACASMLSLEMASLTVIHGDALTFLRSYAWTGKEFIYLDPPYLMTTRSSQRPIYTHEFAEEQQHLELLSLLLTLPADVAISGYASSLYCAMLSGWRSITFQAVTRGGRVATEHLWMNYPQPARLHDYRYLGSNFRERERIKRKMQRWKQRLDAMPALEKYALMAILAEKDDEISPE